VVPVPHRHLGQVGVARASSASVTDPGAVRALFAEVAGEFGGLDIVVSTAGILRFAPFLEASQDDWQAVLDVHLNGYLNVLAGALPVMAAAGHGRVVGVTSGAGLARAAADSAHYSCAKRAVAAVTWQLAGLLPEGVTLNALSPLAATRMVTGGRDPGRSEGSDPAGLDLSAMPAPQDMAPAAAYLAGALASALARCGMTAIDVASSSAGFAVAEEAVRRAGDLDAIVIAPGSFAADPHPPPARRDDPTTSRHGPHACSHHPPDRSTMVA
jgi:NAD(P)-dependent dehydrogenase (short-subunit alcohol dehydrogenase family)